MLDDNELYVIETDGSIHVMNFVGDSDWDIEPTTSLQEIRNKAIDEFVNQLKRDVFIEEGELLTKLFVYEIIEATAEEIKNNDLGG